LREEKDIVSVGETSRPHTGDINKGGGFSVFSTHPVIEAIDSIMATINIANTCLSLRDTYHSRC